MRIGSEGDRMTELISDRPYFLTTRDWSQAGFERRMNVHGGSKRETNDLYLYC